MNDIYVFLGPTLAEKDAKAELDAVYLPPVSAGDVYRLWRRRPRVIGIVDGSFDRVPAVWHKEIMWIMERGVHVFGGAGLGALRAAELDTFGMRGVGWVYQAFRKGTLDRDDEVAVRHGGAEDGYRALSEALVNIRRTLQAAEHQGIISAATHDILAVTGTALFYHDRTWPELLRAGRVAGTGAAELDALRQWLPAGRIDQQADDAVAMLREMHGFLAADPPPQQVSWSMANTAMWEAARRRADTMPGAGAAGSALMLEGILDEIRLLGPGVFEAARCRSLLRVFAADFAERVGMTIEGERLHDAVAEFRVSRNLEQGADLARFLADNDLSADDFQRLVVDDELVRWACGQAEWDALDDLLNDLRLHGEYSRLVTTARAKLDYETQEGAPADGADSEQAAIRWYFADRRGTTVPNDLAIYAQSCGFPDEQAFCTAVRHEYQYTRDR
jgi:AraC-like DNA-binding protein